MKTTRRQFLELAAATGVSAMVPWRRAYAEAQSPALRKFMQMLPGLGPAGIPVASPISYLGATTTSSWPQGCHPTTTSAVA